MKFSIILIFISLLFAVTVKAGIFTTEPFGRTTWSGGSVEKIVWKENGTAPLLTDLLSLNVELFMGNDTTQTFVALIQSGVKGTDLQLTYAVPKNVGPSGQYFIRYTQGTYEESSGIFNIVGVNGKIPQSSPSPTYNVSGLPTTATGYNPYNSVSTGTTGSTSAATNSAASSTPTKSSSVTTPASISGGSMIYSNYLTLGSSIILGKILLKYL